MLALRIVPRVLGDGMENQFEKFEQERSCRDDRACDIRSVSCVSKFTVLVVLIELKLAESTLVIV